MSVYRRPGSPHWHYEFRLAGLRFRGSTGATDRRAAERVEAERRDAALLDAARRRAAEAGYAGQGPLTLSAACARYWHERGQHHAGADTTWRYLEGILAHFGEQREMEQIRDADIAAWVAQRRGARVKGRADAPLVSAATVNRSTVDALARVFGHARQAWRRRFEHEPTWKTHRLRERGPVINPIRAEDEDRVLAALPEGYREYWAFALATGLRLAECRLTWAQVDMAGCTAEVIQKGGRPRRVVLGRAAMAILSACAGRDQVHVFTYVCRRRGGARGAPASRRKLGQRYPVTIAGMKSAWALARKTLGLACRFHDTRHALASRILAATGNLKLAQLQLGHADITTTATYYAHLADADIRAGLDAATARTTPHTARTMRAKSRKGLRE